MQKLPNSGGEFSILMNRIFKDFNREEINDWAITAWAIWNARNRFVFEGCQLPPVHIQREVVALGQDYPIARSTVQF
jgi:hypothetical protein